MAKMQIRREAASAIAFRLVAVNRVVCKIVPDKTFEPFECLLRAARNAVDKLN
jgi:hypothetical protein